MTNYSSAFLSKFERRSGSALLMTLMVASLLMVIILSFVVYVRMELRAVINLQQQMHAKANAKLGMEIALGQLQDIAGADTRTTAPADVLRGDQGNVYRPALTRNAANRYWTGVWDSSGFDEKDPTAKPFLGWLVSGVPDDPTAPATAPTGDWVPLLSDNRVNSGDEIEVPAVDLANGRYAYWVSDEGVKARFDLADPYRGATDADTRQLSLRSGQRHGAELLTSDGTTPLAQGNLYPVGNAVFDETLERVIETDQLPLLGAANSPANLAYAEFIRNRYHDVTLVSEGLMTNSRDGGFKKDLSLAFEMPLDDFNASEFASTSPDSEVPLYRPAGYPNNESITPLFTVSDFSPYGFQPENSPDDRSRYTIAPKVRSQNWHFFRNYYRLYKDRDPDRSQYGLEDQISTLSGGRRVYQAQGLWPRLNGYANLRRFGQDVHAWSYSRTWNGPNGNASPIGRPIVPAVSPVPTRFQTVMSIKSVPSTTSTNSVIELYLDSVFTIMNPYSVPLTSGELNGQPLQVSVRYQDVGFEMQVRDSTGTRTFRRTLSDILKDQDSSYNWKNDETYMLDLQVPSGFVMEPGEVVLFSGVGNRLPYIRNENGNSISGVNLELNPGVTANLPTDSGIYFPNMWQREFEPSAEIRTRFYLTSSLELEGKLIVNGVNRTSVNSERFFDTFVANARNISRTWSDWIPLDEAVLTSGKRPLSIYDASLKTQSSRDPVNLMSHFNVRANMYTQGSTWDVESQAYEEPGDNGKEDLWWGEWVPVDNWIGNWLSNSGRNGYWGESNTASGSRFVSLFEVPQSPLLSVASLQHAQSTFLSDEPPMPIGNSYRHLFVDLDEVMTLQPLNANNIMVAENKVGSPKERSQWTMTRVDWSYVLNQKLFDGYFFSGIAPDEQSGATAAQRYTAFQTGATLPQATLRYTPGIGISDSDARGDLFTSGGVILPDAPDRSAAQLRVKGAFNVNSTSVEAWRALLSSTRQLAIDVQGQAQPINPTGTVFTRNVFPENQQNQDWSGFRNLTDTQINRLAEEIVREVQVRGPFLTLSDFVNRRLRPTGHDTQLSGPIQAAIDTAGINAQFTESLTDAGMNPNDLNPFVRAHIDSNSPVAMGATGYLTQADVLTVIGPLLSNRSDTFVIRSFGETEDGGARAWCEAVVQRVPDYVDSSKRSDEPASWAPTAIPPNTGSYDTLEPRRRFKIISFRWLGAEDV